METLTKEFFVEQFDSFRKEFDSIRAEMVTKTDFNREISSVRQDIAELTERASDAFTSMTNRFVTLETKVTDTDTKVDTLIRFDHQHQIDVLRDDMRVVKTHLGLA